MSDRLQEVIAGALQMPPQAVTDDLEFDGTSNWDSLNHITLMLALEEEFEISISDDELVELTSVGAIREYVDRVAPTTDVGSA
jgi:acyl carrier protein